MSNNKEEHIEIESYKWYRNCPSCGNQIIFSNQFTCEASFNVTPICKECQENIKNKIRKNRIKGCCTIKSKRISSRKIVQPIEEEDYSNYLAFRSNDDAWIRKCPECHRDIVHRGKKSEITARYYLKKKLLCRSCAATKRDNLVYEVGVAPPIKCRYRGGNISEEEHKNRSESKYLCWAIKKAKETFINYNGTGSLPEDCRCKKLE